MKCEHCGHEWLPIVVAPMYCPRCHVAISEEGKEHKRNYYKDYARKYLLCTTVGGKTTVIKTALKRPRPDGCELCAKNTGRLVYHHWDDEDLSKGIWLCVTCHKGAEASDKSLIDKYLRLKAQIEEAP